MTTEGPWRTPAEESDDLYPGLSVCDNRVTGSIVVGGTRLPLWAFAYASIVEGWESVDSDYDIAECGLTDKEFGGFLSNLMEARGEFGRLLLVLADAERCDVASGRVDTVWWRTKRQRGRVAEQLRRCLAVLEEA